MLTALLARDLGGGRGAQVLAAAGGAAAFPLIFGHVLLTATLDLVLMAAILLCLCGRCCATAAGGWRPAR